MDFTPKKVPHTKSKGQRRNFAITSVSIDADLWDAYGMVAEHVGVTRSELSRQLIEAFVNDYINKL